jgi:N-methylhydantoinase A
LPASWSSAPPTCASRQEHAVTVELPIELFRARGSRRHQAALRCRARNALRLFGAGGKGEIVSLRSAVTGLLRKPHSSRSPQASASRRRPLFAHAPVYFAEAGAASTRPTYDRAALLAEQRITGRR